MRRVLWMLLLIVAISSNAQTVISLNGTTYSEVTMPRRDVEEVDDGIIVTYYFDNAIAQQDLLYPECILWKIPGFGLNETVGEPAIPFRWDSFSLPQNVNIGIEVLDSSFVDFPMQLSPARPVLIDSDMIEHTLDHVLPIAPYDGFSPASLVESSVGNAYRGVPLLEVGIFPLQYDYEQHIVRAYRMIKYKITFMVSSRSSGASSTIDINDNYLSLTTINSPSTTSQARNISQTTVAEQSTRDYLIITNSTLRPIAEEFAEWKRTLGFRTHVSTNERWIRQTVIDTISQYYNNPDYKLYYLLIIGDDNVMPSTPVSHSLSHNCITDLYYACMDGENDYVPDIHYGRIPVEDTLEAKNIFNKIRSYEEKPTNNELFYKSGLNCAYFQDVNKKDGYADRRFAQTSEEVLQYLIGQGKIVHRVYYTEEDKNPLCWNNDQYGLGDSIPNYLRKPMFAWNGNYSNIISHINQGVFYVLHRDHGEAFKWRDPCFEKKHIAQLTNQDRLPVVFSLNCNTGRYHESMTEDCFAEAFLKKESGGCVAIYAATGSSLSGYNDALTTGMFDAIWPIPGLRSEFPSDAAIDSLTSTPTPTYELGQILKVGMARMQETWGGQHIKTKKSTIYNIRENYFMYLVIPVCKSIPTDQPKYKYLRFTVQKTLYM